MKQINQDLITAIQNVNWTEHFKRVGVEHHTNGTLIKMDNEILVTIGKSLEGGY